MLQASRVVPFLIGLSVLTGGALAGGEETVSTVDYNQDVRPLLSDRCYACHGPDEDHRQAGFRLDVRESAFGEADSGERPIVAGDLESSAIIARIMSDDPDLQMPPPDSNKSLTAAEREVIRKWVAEGAAWEEHWAFLPPQKPAPPAVKLEAWPTNPIDRFILARLEREGLQPSSPTDKLTLLRRLTFDLTGLPPTLDEIDAFLADDSPEAYERVVDRLLDSPHYGEHLARFWLDAARYGDTHGLHLDNFREMWPYRDWVVNAFNSNMPYDQFATEQLAGDLLPNPTEDQLIATGFNRCHVTTNEGGSITEEVYVRNVVDRVVTTGTVFMGLTLECTRCHDHKYDPVTMKEFYSLFAYFNSLDGNAMDGNKAEHPPVLRKLLPEAEQRLKEVLTQKEKVQQRLTARRQEVAASEAFAEWQVAAAANSKAEDQMPAGLLAHYPLDAAEGAEVSSAVSSIAPGKIEGKVQRVSGKHGGALRFDGQSYVDLGDTANFERDQAFSYGAWVRPAKNGGAGVLARMNADNKHRGYDFYLAGSKVAVHLIHSWSGNALKVTTKKDLKQDQWQHVFATYDGSSKAAGLKVYFDGQLQEVEVNVDNLTGTTKSNVHLRIGARTPNAHYKGEVDDVRIYDRELTAAEVAVLAGNDPIAPILALAADERTEQQNEQLLSYYLAQEDPEYQQLDAELKRLSKEQADAEAQSGTTLIWKELAEPRPAYILNRGEYDQRRDQVERSTPGVLPPLPEGAPNNRLGLAQWLIDPSHPLTARVAVNRFWQQVFGTGLVKTAEDFGSQGEPPSHPQLLDWLAVQFQEDGWDIKRLMKRIVMSSTYRQSSQVTAELYERDPENRLLARGPRFRLDAEMLRDQALAVSDLLSRRIGGPSVKPPQPDGLWFAVGYSGSNTVRFKQDEGHEKVHRRTLYTFIKRTAPPPQMSTFDAPSRESCTVRRARTNTPLQALLLLNDPQYVEAARGLAERTIREAGESAQDKAAYMFRLCTARFPDDEESAELVRLFEEQQSRYEADPEAAKKLVAIGESTPDPSLNPTQVAAWTVLANLILNLDEVVTKN